MAAIVLSGVRKRYGDTQVIHGIDVDVDDGEFIVIVGPSGCGKSTLLRMVAGLEVITSGEIRIGGRVVNDLEPKDRDIAMVFQNYALYPHMSVFNNMAYGLKIAGHSKDDIRQRVARAAEMLELATLLDRKPRQLSGGQRQRVAMGRAIVRDPSAFLFDEPLSNLDAKLRVQMRLEIKKLQHSLGTTSLYVTHDQVEAMTLADRLVVMNEGRAEQIDAPIEVYERPASVFVAGFIGSPAMNFLPGTAGEGGELSLADGRRLTREIPVPEPSRGRGITIGVRPEDLEPCAEPESDMSVRVNVTETLGADTLVHGRLHADGGDPAAVTVRLPGKSRVEDDTLCHFRIKVGGLHLFDSQSGHRIGG
jgi:sn-glycerol 3-phosphate transport system ATP-binding protein